MSFEFKDAYGNTVFLNFNQEKMKKNPGHVFVICRYSNSWLLTNHKRRGFEFPGGKVEYGESPEEAAKREVYEETGGIIESIQLIGQYEVVGEYEQLVKNIYFAIVNDVEEKTDYLETMGPVVIQHTLEKDKLDGRFSFIMRDEVLQKSIEFLKVNGLIE